MGLPYRLALLGADKVDNGKHQCLIQLSNPRMFGIALINPVMTFLLVTVSWRPPCRPGEVEVESPCHLREYLKCRLGEEDSSSN